MAIGYHQRDDARRAAENRGDRKEAKRIARLLERLDEQRLAYGRAMRGGEL
jgi:hypothetical protein